MPGARPRGRDVFGLLLLDKPIGWSSNQALQRVKRLYGAAKAGHTGSLDPLATGMLPIFFGAATRLAGFLLDARKVYRVTAVLGVATDTGDEEGRVIAAPPTERPPTEAGVRAALCAFVGEIEQVPPMYSALKRDGVPLYRLARRGLEVERQPRRVVVDELTLERYDWPALTLLVRCSKGTYIRTLVEDLAIAMGTVGHVGALRRVAVEPFAAGPMHTYAALEAAATGGFSALDELLLPPEQALTGWAAVDLSPELALRLAQGQSVPADPAWPVGPVKVYGQPHEFLALATVTADGQLAPQRVFRR